MHTKHQIQQLLASAGVFPNKHFGQHFLIDLNLLRLMIDSANIEGDDIVLEVGCGTGSLTEGLAERAAYCIAVEVDDTLAKIAQDQLAGKGNVEVINTDILESKHNISGAVIEAIEQARKKHSGRLLLVANLPYNVACPVMLNLVEGPTVVDRMYVTVQKQVAERMVAKPGSGDYGTLSIFLSATGEVKTERILKPTVFWPQPQVESAMVSFVRNQEKANRIKSVGLFAEVINLFMGHRRKMLKACTKFASGGLAKIDNWPGIFEQCSIDPTQRPEKLPPEDYITIANLCSGLLEEYGALLRMLHNKSGTDAKTAQWGKVTIRLRPRLQPKVDENLLEEVVKESNLGECGLVLILDDKDSVEYTQHKRRAVSFSSADVDLIKHYGYIDPIDIKQKNQWKVGVYIPKITAEKWADFRAYFAFVLGHELEHNRIMLENLDLHRCTSWLAEYDNIICAKAGDNYNPKKPWEFKWEQQCNKKGKEIAISLGGDEEFVRCLKDLMHCKNETQEHKKYLDFLLNELEGMSYKDNICDQILGDFQVDYDLDLRRAAHKVWKQSKECTLFAKRFNLETFLPLS